ncbi:VOC family protein [Tengunoibacter tsumagoiensis]|uniref:Glyoxalase/bleomycin resistance/dioxygenase family protein n=1 Tax=Tengunoibacter tsumagoiensis TaxID=2014871 RepID=A0A402A0T5_9CHLR|nr:VOC family protein [Tengunoibacter tsumagoiensis]GCE12724.1 glyoxalase/bleomycin resistance/dioxygenase family protein [Tengunoibacter tsumagoiensis]
MELYGVRLLVSDFSASVHFWRDIMKFSAQFLDEELGYAYFDLGKVGLELHQQDVFAEAIGETTPVPLPRERQVILDFKVENVDATYAELVALGATSISQPTDRPAWRARTAHIADPDGHLLEIYTSLT